MRSPQHLIICATPRTGSTMIYDDIRVICGLPTNEEEPLFRYLFQHRTHRTFNDVLADMNNTHAIQSVVCFKTMFQHIASITEIISTQLPIEMSPDSDFAPAKTERFVQAFPNTCWVHVERRDVFAQAVSMYFAYITNVWHADPDFAARNEGYNEDVPYDSDALVYWLKYIYAERVQWARFFAHYRINPFRIFYEDAISNFPHYWDDVVSALALKKCASPQPRRWKKLGNSRNSRFIDMLVADIKRRIEMRDTDFETLKLIYSSLQHENP